MPHLPFARSCLYLEGECFAGLSSPLLQFLDLVLQDFSLVILVAVVLFTGLYLTSCVPMVPLPPRKPQQSFRALPCSLSSHGHLFAPAPFAGPLPPVATWTSAVVLRTCEELAFCLQLGATLLVLRCEEPSVGNLFASVDESDFPLTIQLFFQELVSGIAECFSTDMLVSISSLWEAGKNLRLCPIFASGQRPDHGYIC